MALMFNSHPTCNSEVLMDKVCGSNAGYCYAYEESRTDPNSVHENETSCHEKMVRLIRICHAAWIRLVSATERVSYPRNPNPNPNPIPNPLPATML